MAVAAAGAPASRCAQLKILRVYDSPPRCAVLWKRVAASRAARAKRESRRGVVCRVSESVPFAAAAWLYPFTAWPGRPVATRTRPRSLIIATRLRTGTDMPSFRTNIAFSRSAVTHRRSSAVMTATMNPRFVRPAPSALGPAHTPRIAGREPGVAHPSDTETPCRAQNTIPEPHTTASRNRPPLRRTHCDGAGGPSQGATSQRAEPRDVSRVSPRGRI